MTPEIADVSQPDEGVPRPPRAALFGALCGALFWVVVTAVGPRLPQLEGTIAEVDGVFPLRAVEAWHDAYAPGAGFLDKYPAFPSWLAGAWLALVESEFVDAAEPLVGLRTAEDRVHSVGLEPAHGRAVDAIRALSTAATAAVVALVAGLGVAWSVRAGVPRAVAWGASAVTAALFAASNVTLYHALSTNVDALVVALSLGAVALLAARRPRVLWSAPLVGLAVATKDPAYAIGAVMFVVAWRQGGPRRALGATGIALAVYAVATGAVVNPGAFADHARYLVSGGVDTVPRIDPTSPAAWWRLASHVVTLTAWSLGRLVPLAALAGLVLLATRRGTSTSAAWAAGLAVAAPLMLFVAPVRFVYARFLFVPYAVAAALAAVALGLLAEWAGWRWRALVVVAAAAAVGVDGERLGLFDLAAGRVTQTSPRRDAAAFVERVVPEGGRVVIFSSATHHPPPIDPRARRVELHALDAPARLLPTYRDAPPAARPDALVFMTFTMDPPTGEAAPRPEVQPVGKRVAGVYEVAAVFGAPLGRAAERVLPVRPLVTVLTRVE